MRRRILFLAAGVLLRPILNEQLHACNRSRARPERVRGTVEALDAPEFSLRDSETGRVYTIILTDETVLLSGTREVARTALRPGGPPSDKPGVGGAPYLAQLGSWARAGR